jgi:hypothetical protein
MSLVAPPRANNLSQLNTVTEIKYSSRNSTVRDHSMIPVRVETPVHGPARSFGTVQAARDRPSIYMILTAGPDSNDGEQVGTALHGHRHAPAGGGRCWTSRHTELRWLIAQVLDGTSPGVCAISAEAVVPRGRSWRPRCGGTVSGRIAKHAIKRLTR